MGKTWAALACLALVGLAIAGCGTPAAGPAAEETLPVDEPAPAEPEPSADEPPAEPPAGEEAAEVPERAELTIVDFSYRPGTATVLVGGTVVWSHEDSAPHTVTSDEGLFDSGTMSQGGVFQFAFTAPGRYLYHCEIHPSITGVIEVVEAGQAAATGDAGAAGGENYYSD